MACSTFKAYYSQLTVFNCLFIKFLYLSTVKLDIISLTVTECPNQTCGLIPLLFYLFLMRLLIIFIISFIHIAWHCLVLTIWQVASHFKECFVPQLFLYQALWGHPWPYWSLLQSHALCCRIFDCTKTRIVSGILQNSGNQIDELLAVYVSTVSEKHTIGQVIHFKKKKVGYKPIWTKKVNHDESPLIKLWIIMP